MRTLNHTKSFGKAIKKLHSNVMDVLKEEILKVKENPSVGEEKKGDLTGVWVHKLKALNQLYLVAYIFTESDITFIYFGTHEIFFRDLKLVK